MTGLDVFDGGGGVQVSLVTMLLTGSFLGVDSGEEKDKERLGWWTSEFWWPSICGGTGGSGVAGVVGGPWCR